MKNGTRRLLLYTSLSALIFIILFKPSVTLAKKSEPFKTSVASLGFMEWKTDKGRESNQDITDPIPPENPNLNPDPVIPPVEKPEDKPLVPDQEEKPNLPEPEKPNPPSQPEQDKSSGQNKDPLQNTKPKPETSSPTKPQNSRPSQNTNNSNSWTNPNRTNGTIYSPRESVNTQPTNDIQPINEEQTDLSIEEEVESEELDVIEEEPEVDLAQLSLKELIEMMESGEIIGEVRNDKYFVISNETKEQREVTKEEALELGIIEEEEEEPAEEVEIVEETSEIIVEPAAEAIKSERTKMPLYISAVGLTIIIAGSLMYFLQSRRSRN